MKNKILGIGVIALLMGSCTVVYPVGSDSQTAVNNTPRQAYTDQQQYSYNQQYSDQQSNDGYADDWDSDTTAAAEPRIDYNSGAYDDGYVYNPAYFNSNFYAGDPYWGLGLYAGWGWNPYWGIGIGYGWGGYYGWGSIYSGWGGYFGWGGYYPWGYWGWGGGYGYGRGGYAPYIVGNRTGGFTRAGVAATGSSFARSSNLTRSATGFTRRSGATANREMNVANTRGQRAFVSNNNNTLRTFSSNASRASNVRSYSSPNRTYSAPSRSYSAPSRSYSAPSRSFSGGGSRSGGFSGGFHGGGRR